MQQPAFGINYRSRLMLVALFALLVVGFWTNDLRSGDEPLTAPATAPQNALGQGLSPQAQNELITLIRSANLADLRWPNFSDYHDQVLTFYEAGAYSLAWVGNNQPT